MNQPAKVRRRGAVTKLVPLALLSATCLAPEARAQAQVIFGIDFRGATISQPDTVTGTPIHESELLRPPGGQPAFGPLPPPGTQFNGAQLGLSAYSMCIGQTPGTTCQIEVDAISFGNDAKFIPGLPIGAPGRARIFFSVDRLAHGAGAIGLAPNVRSEGALGMNEAAADVFTVIGTIAGPAPVPPVPGGNVGVFDGNGLPNAAGKRYRGLGLREQGQMGPFDDLDTLSIAPIPTAAGGVIYFSLEGALVDPLTLQTGSNSAAVAGFPPSAIVRRNVSGGPVQIYATPSQLGLHPTADDLDALLIGENGVPGYQPSLAPNDWVTGATDMVCFSVRRGSAVINQLDSILNIPITAGDILVPPPPGVGPSTPGIYIPAEALGLRSERGDIDGDELDALGSEEEPYLDCNGNGRDDSEDIAVGFSSDSNGNGIPDECERIYSRYCFCDAPNGGPCGNDSATTGCLNSSGPGGLLSGAGTTSVATDDLTMPATTMTPSTFGLLFTGPSQMNIPFSDGRLCVGPTIYRLQIKPADLGGAAVFGPGFVAMSNGIGGPAVITAGVTMNFQVWYRDSAAFCTPATNNLTNGLTVTFSP